MAINKAATASPPATVKVLRRRAGGYELLQGFYADLRTARLARPCAVCGRDILPGECYFAVITCAGLGALKFPSRVHRDELDAYWRLLEERFESELEVKNG